MKTLPDTNVAVAKNSAITRSPLKVCMHVVGVVRTDYRVLREANGLAEAGFEVCIVDVERDPTRPAEEDIQSVHIKHLIRPAWFIPTRFKPWFLVKLARLSISAAIRLIRTPADIYHAHNLNTLLACYIAARWHRKPLVFDSHELPLHDPNYTRWRRLSALAMYVFRRILPHCAAVITTSPSYVEEFRSNYHFPAVTLVRNVLPYQVVPRSDRLRQYLGLAPQVRIALYQGYLQPNRGLDRYVRAAPFLEPNIVIVMMGKENKRGIKAQLEALITSEGVADRVKILPPVPYAELLAWTASADIGLNVPAPDYSPDIKGCLANKLFEYLMAGLPVLNSQLDAAMELIKRYDVGQVVASLAPADVAAAINAMLADPVALERMRRNALATVKDELCWEKERNQLLRLYGTVLGMQNAEYEAQKDPVS